MSCIGYKPTIEVGDDVIVYLTYKNSYAQRVERGRTFQTKFGALRHDFMIGKPYGSRIETTKGFVHILHPTPDLWTDNIQHRTQILWPSDINLVLLELDVRPGSVVLEAGTGSGSLTHALARTVAPGGHVYTFDFHQQRVDAAAADFAQHGAAQLISVALRDVCVDGFPDALLGRADAVFLDLPRPFEAVPHAKRVLRTTTGGRVCCFSPCIEQVQRNAAALRSNGFAEVETIECGFRTLKAQRVTRPCLDERLKGEETAIKRRKVEGGGAQAEEQSQEKDRSFFCDVMPFPVKQPTHTGYVTFGTLPPLFGIPGETEGAQEMIGGGSV